MAYQRKQEQEEASTEVTQAAPGVLRMQLPIQMPGLGHVNAYLLVDDRGAALVDAGLPGPATWTALQDRLKKAQLSVGDIHTVIVTHSHPDHFGTAGRVAKESGAEFVTHSAFRTWWAPHSHADAKDGDGETDGDGESGGDEVHDVDPEHLSTHNPFRGETPWGGTPFRPPMKRRLQWKLMQAGLGRRAIVPPTPTMRVKHGDVLKLAGREWFAVHTPGHTLDHLCLHDPEGGVLLSGDHVLPTITPHISGLGAGPDPLAGFFSSLDRVAALPGVETVLPAHGLPFTDLVGRVEAIKSHHLERLDRLGEISAAIGPSTVTEFSHHLFRKARWGSMAESETYAHLEHLRLLGKAVREDKDGEAIFRVETVDA
jgi:glyoxylase-like metal-dependent hydrolase (beta-lactamase superfamily II)